MTDVIVVGGGPAGMMAAATAALYGKKVVLLEKNSRCGRKLAITGKGRCNVTNDCDETAFLQNVPTNPKFLYSVIRAFGTQDTKDWFEGRGVALKTERGNRVFPQSDRAQDIVEAMVRACKESGVEIRECEAEELLCENGRVCGVLCSGGQRYLSRSVIVATGGASYPLTGSTGDGYRFAEQVGHTVTERKPSLVPLVSDSEDCRDMQGLSLRNVTVSLWDKRMKKKLFSELGEMLFTHYGMSGPLILSASSLIRAFEPDRYEIQIDLKPGLDDKQLDARILRDFSKYANRDFINALSDLLPKKMIPIIVYRSRIPAFTKVNSITKVQRRALFEQIRCFSVPVDGFRPIEEAIVTAGGVSCREINPRTMESKLCPGLYFAGEVLDVDGYTGGFNLQIAFSTGYAAGSSC